MDNQRIVARAFQAQNGASSNGLPWVSACFIDQDREIAVALAFMIDTGAGGCFVSQATIEYLLSRGLKLETNEYKKPMPIQGAIDNGANSIIGIVTLEWMLPSGRIQSFAFEIVKGLNIPVICANTYLRAVRMCLNFSSYEMKQNRPAVTATLDRTNTGAPVKITVPDEPQSLDEVEPAEIVALHMNRRDARDQARELARRVEKGGELNIPQIENEPSRKQN